MLRLRVARVGGKPAPGERRLWIAFGGQELADYNQRWPHSALGYATPAAYAAQLTVMGDRLRGTEALR